MQLDIMTGTANETSPKTSGELLEKLLKDPSFKLWFRSHYTYTTSRMYPELHGSALRIQTRYEAPVKKRVGLLEKLRYYFLDMWMWFFGDED